MSSSLNQLVKIQGFISKSIDFVTTKFSRNPEQHTLVVART